MYLMAAHVELQIITAFVTGHDLHFSRFPHDHGFNLSKIVQETLGNIRRAQQANLFIARQSKLQWALQIH